MHFHPFVSPWQIFQLDCNHLFSVLHLSPPQMVSNWIQVTFIASNNARKPRCEIKQSLMWIFCFQKAELSMTFILFILFGLGWCQLCFQYEVWVLGQSLHTSLQQALPRWVMFFDWQIGVNGKSASNMVHVWIEIPFSFLSAASY